MRKRQSSDGSSRSLPTFGTAYYPDHWPEADWVRDLDHIRDTGISTIRFGEFSWTWFEPKAGRFDWRAYDRFVRLFEQRDLKLVLCTPTATPPPWFIRRFPDGRMQDVFGNACHAVRHYWCWHHERSRAQAAKSIVALIRHFRGCPAVISWQIDNEPNLSESETIYDYNPHALTAFRGWLREKYNDSLDAVNRAWYTNFWSQRYSTWDEIGILAFHLTNPQAWLDFARFRDHGVAKFVQWQADLIRREDPSAKVGTNIPETGAKLSLQIAQDYFAQAKGLDWVGTDLYTASGNRPADVRSMRFSTDLMRNVAGLAEFIITETQAGPHQRTWPQGFAGETWEPDFLDTCVRTYIEHGARQVWFFLFRPTPAGWEMGMNGLASADGSPSPRTKLVQSLSRQKPALLRLQQKRQQRPLALMHYSRDSIRFIGIQPPALTSVHDSYQGWHQLLDEAGYRIDFINDEQLAAGNLPAADLLVLPQSHVMSDAQIHSAADAGSMQVIVGPHTAMLDEFGHLRQAHPGGELAELTGVVPGFWHDIGKPMRLSLKGVAAISAWRDSEVNGSTSSIQYFTGGKQTAAIVRSKRVMWCAFDVGMAYRASTTSGQTALRRAILRSGQRKQ